MNYYQMNKKYLKQLVARHVKEGFLKRNQIIDLVMNEFNDLVVSDDTDSNTKTDTKIDTEIIGGIKGGIKNGINGNTNITDGGARAASFSDSRLDDWGRLDLSANARERRLRQLEIWTDHALALHREEERRYPPLTDCDRIDRAFQKLQEQDIIARQHFSCCNSCGHRQIETDGIKLMMRGQKKRGYVFYHKDDTERAARSGLLYLTFGAFSEPDPSYASETSGARQNSQRDQLQGSQLDRNQAIGEILQETLASEGLEVSWSGSALHRISVTLNWQKRRQDLAEKENERSMREKSERKTSGSFKRKRANLKIVG